MYPNTIKAISQTHMMSHGEHCNGTGVSASTTVPQPRMLFRRELKDIHTGKEEVKSPWSPDYMVLYVGNSKDSIKQVLELWLI